MEWLRAKAGEFEVRRGFDEKRDRQIAAGAGIDSEEQPVILTPDDDPFYEEPAISRVERVRQSRQARSSIPPF